MAVYQIKEETLKVIANAIRAKTDSTARMTPVQMAARIEEMSFSGVVLDPEGVAFSSVQVTPDVNYKVGYNWIAQLVGLVQSMAGLVDDLTLEDILYWLGRVKTIPQGRASSAFALRFGESAAAGILPVVVKGSAGSEFTLNFGSSAAGAMQEE